MPDKATGIFTMLIYVGELKNGFKDNDKVSLYRKFNEELIEKYIRKEDNPEIFQGTLKVRFFN